MPPPDAIGLRRGPGRRCARALLTVWICLLAAGVARGAVTNRVVRGLKVLPRGDWTKIELHLDGRFRYISHSASGASSTLHIRLRGEGEDRASELGDGETLEWSARDLVPLVSIVVEVDARGDPGLLLRFEHPVEFQIRQEADLESLSVLVRTRTAGRQTRSSTRRAPEEADDARTERIMAEGRKAMTEGSFERAAMLFTKILEGPGDARAPEAKELLGLAYQRAGRLAHASAEYEEYLAAYPEHEGASRVAQRLRALQSARGSGQKRAERRKPERSTWQHSFSGSESQFYRLDEIDTDVRGIETVNSSVDTDLFLSSRHAKGLFSARTNFSGSYRYDLLDELDAADAVRFTSAFVDLSSRGSRYSARVGRQSAAGGGVLGRFDGLRVWRQLAGSLRLSLVGGFPVDFADSNRIDSQRVFSGLSIDAGPFLERWDAQLYAIRQQINGIEDRAAVGGQIRYAAGQSFALALVDYDTSYSSLNTLMFVSSWRLTEGTGVGATLDIRKSPALSTFNALQGQAVEDFDELETLFNEDQIRDLAVDRTAESRTYTLTASHSLSESWQLFGDVTLSNLSGTDASGGVPATPGTGNEYFVSFRATGAGLLFAGSFTTFGLQLADTDASDRYSLTVAGRYPLLKGLRLGPRLLVEYRKNETTADQWKYRPSLRLDARWRRVHLELEGGVDLEKGTANDTSADETEYFVTVGGRYDF